MEAQKIEKEEVLKRVSLLPEAQLAKVVSLLDKLEMETGGSQHYSEAIEKVWGLLAEGRSSSEAFAKRKAEEKLLDK